MVCGSDSLPTCRDDGSNTQIGYHDVRSALCEYSEYSILFLGRGRPEYKRALGGNFGGDFDSREMRPITIERVADEADSFSWMDSHRVNSVSHLPGHKGAGLITWIAVLPTRQEDLLTL